MQSHPFTIHNRVDLPWNLPEKEIVDSLVTCLIGDTELESAPPVSGHSQDE